MKRYSPYHLALAVIVIILVCATAGRSQTGKKPENKQDDPLQVFMQAKLEHSQRILEGLTTDNCELVAKHAQQLSLLSQAAQWQVLQTPEYVHRSAQFRHLADTLTDEARKKNLDGATLAFMKVTMDCIDCHKYVRKTRAL
ncbi:MAG: hypothetical protein R3E01_08425 [Pirellulaceae bacterium]|nr:hypothetical protein [Planctomycetales bacterium]